MARERIEIDPTELSEYTGGRYIPPAPNLHNGDTVAFTSYHGERRVGTFERFDQWELAVVRVDKHFIYHIRPSRLEVI